MATSFDEPPVYDALVNVEIEIKDKDGKSTRKIKADGWLTESWRPWIISIKEFLDNYISFYGIQLPQITQEQRDSLVLTSDNNGFCCFVTTNGGLPVKLPEIYIDGVWYKFNLTVAP